MSNNPKSRTTKTLADYLYYEEKNPDLKIYLGDCLEVMPLLYQTDLVVADPPYGMNFQSNRRTLKHEKIHGDFTFPIETIKCAITFSSRASYIFCRWDNIKDFPKPKSVIAWIKNNWSMGDLKHEHGRQWEACLFYPKIDHEFLERIPDVIHADRTGNDLHPTQKPVSIIRRIIECNVGYNVLDPFLGSGTTLVACKELNRNGIGIEINEKYCEIAKKRLQNTTRSLFNVEPQNNDRPNADLFGDLPGKSGRKKLAKGTLLD